jgi:septum site-determining protein MinD
VAAIISIHSFRGGTGKSNISANLAACLAKSGLRTAVIDTDIQSPGIHVIFGVDQANVRYCLNDYLWGKCGIEEASYDVSKAGGIEESGRLFLIPSSLRSGEIAKILREGYDVALLTDGFQRLIKQLKLDCLLIDTHPGVNEETLLSVAISDLLIVVLRHSQRDADLRHVRLFRRMDLPRRLAGQERRGRRHCGGHSPIAVFSRPLDARGNSVRGLQVCEDLARQFGLHSFEHSVAKEEFFRQLLATR